MLTQPFIYPIILSSLTILAVILNSIAGFSKGEFVVWKTFNRISLAVLLAMAACTGIWFYSSRGGMFLSLQLVKNNLGNGALVILISMFITYQQFLLFQNIMGWISRKASPISLSYSAYAILVPLIVMFVKMPFTNTLDMFPKDNIWGALCFDFGFWHFMTALSLVYAAIMIILQFIQFFVVLRHQGKLLLLTCIVYFPVMLSLFLLSMYAVIGAIMLFIIYFVLKMVGESNQKKDE